MKGKGKMNPQEFEEVVREGWEAEFSVRGFGFHYERYWDGGSYVISLLRIADGRSLYRACVAEVDERVVQEVMACELLPSVSLRELAPEFSVRFVV